ncbi:hypothetical protein [Pontibacter sp. G13]|uniref:hypothetical protein n=1 Tax=Pontibacter sp. G13 TaxID=3074898 RepID=UPI002889FC6D|nr:hypothetical protein [Pontibacter sp. G13]WNJ16215.1 hypothetical protein RJD25_15230 [Pontibacter sp. G13]
MKKSFLLLTLTATFLLMAGTIAQAQRVSFLANVSSFNIDKVDAPNADINYQGSTTLTGNLRIYSKKKWAIRLGAGIDNLKYQVDNGLTTDYEARRTDIKGLIGLEKHFVIKNSLTLYPGVYVPIVVTGDDIIQSNYENIENGNMRAGFGVVLGTNIKIFKILRVGLEFDASYDDFKTSVWESVDNVSLVPIKGINHRTSFTLGVAF